MLVEDQFGVGDIVDVGEATGVVETVTLRITRIRDVKGTLWHVPNGEIQAGGQLSAAVGQDHPRRPGGPQHRPRGGHEVIRTSPPDLYDDARPGGRHHRGARGVGGRGSSGPTSWLVRLAVKTEPSEQWKVARLLRARLKRAFDESGIVIPFPQRTVWMKRPVGGEPPPVALRGCAGRGLGRRLIAALGAARPEPTQASHYDRGADRRPVEEGPGLSVGLADAARRPVLPQLRLALQRVAVGHVGMAWNPMARSLPRANRTMLSW